MVLAAIVQFCARHNVKDNTLRCVDAIKCAAGKGAKAVFLPEASDFIGQGDAYNRLSEPLESGYFMNAVRDAAKASELWVSVCVHEAGGSDGRCFNTQVLISDKGSIDSSYRKIHLFDVKDVGPGNTPVLESASTEPGRRVEQPRHTPFGRTGMLTCYDLRFPEVSLMLREKGADVITYPSSFAAKTELELRLQILIQDRAGRTGVCKALSTLTHSPIRAETLLRARAIETQCYVIAAAQAGVHTHAGRTSYGRSMVVNPWGGIVTQLGACNTDPKPYDDTQPLPDTPTEIAYFDIDLEEIQKVRAAMPLQQQRRHDIYAA
ncbi:hypothetical protein E3P89_03098 [Wallemia ichthyophaga]|uniref:CN hydrolase domain-containing protein n=1 Tax=Wallemia ichthyophaga TaxID=245174 RepID=A0A4T0HZR5_WALIC|nr:hypothetical protein E3P93_03088 [Wallemia ichthyophaga]TIB09817.1 hypothetical protein E3P90_03119 [Wallemia ichthyophaga]TIB20594.1 hypothetical protein E3P89_03098 [Wallemia ichthyophaga]TIB22220.1 hypothetical protein E3P88_03132 [Wallemia ichthyophaga]